MPNGTSSALLHCVQAEWGWAAQRTLNHCLCKGVFVMKRFIALLIVAGAAGLFALSPSIASAGGCGYGGYGGYGGYRGHGGYHPRQVYRAPVYRAPVYRPVYRRAHGYYPAPVPYGHHHHHGPRFSFGFGF